MYKWEMSASLLIDTFTDETVTHNGPGISFCEPDVEHFVVFFGSGVIWLDLFEFDKSSFFFCLS